MKITPINIDRNNGGPEGHHLEGCHFKETAPGSKEFLLYAPDGSPIHTTVSSGTDFRFSHNGLHWSITEFFITEDPAYAQGKWSAERVIPLSKARPDDDPETGTFQAQGGGSDEPKLSARASVSA